MKLRIGEFYWLALLNAHFLFDRPVPLWMWISVAILDFIDFMIERNKNEEK